MFFDLTVRFLYALLVLMKRHNLTPKQKEFLEFIQEHYRRYGVNPSQREIAKGLGFSSVGTVQRYKVLLEKSGLLKSNAQTRGLELTQKQSLVEALQLPLVGRVAAGRPIEAVENQDLVDVPQSLIRGGEHFVLRVQGDSMRDEAILDGDLVIIKKQVNAENGQTVVALINGEATIKKFYRRAGMIELHPANPNYDVIRVRSSENFKIEGILAGVIRTLD